MYHIKFLLHFGILLFYNAVDTQYFINSSQYTSAEKIYLQTDNDIYTTDKTIWFKAILINSATHSPNFSSGVLYVDLFHSDEGVLESKQIKIKTGIGHGHFDLDRSYPEGVYLLRAYTAWNKNFESDVIFQKKIQIFSEGQNQDFQIPIQNIRRVDSTLTSYRFRADIFPNIIDDSHDENLICIVSQDGNNDTITLKNNNTKYVLDYEVANSTKQVELAFKTANNQTYKTSFSPQFNFIDVQFFPEGGQMVDGLSSKVAFKAVDAMGNGKKVEGVIVNSSGKTITTFKSNALGMGSFYLQDVSLEDTYTAKVQTLSNSAVNSFKLPQVLDKGYVLSVTSRNELIFVSVATNKKDSQLTLKGICRGIEYANQKAKTINGSYIYTFPKVMFPDGIIVFTLFDESQFPIAERLYFNRRKEARIDISLSTNKSTYSTRERLNLNIGIERQPDSSLVFPSNVSILVLKKAIGMSQLRKENILSYFLLSSEIKGNIESPGFYFEKGNDAALDHLLLTQGWRKYKYRKPLLKQQFKLEKNLNVSGVINLKDSKSKPRTIELMLMTFDDKRSIYSQAIKVPGTFNFELNDMYGDDKEILVQPLNTLGKHKDNFIISFHKKKILPIDFDFSRSSVVTDRITETIVNENRAYKAKESAYNFNTFGTTVLDEVIIDGYKLTPKRKEVMDRYGRPNKVFDGKVIQEKENQYTTGLFSALNTRDFMKDILIKRDQNGRLTAESRNGGKDHVTLFLVDGVPVMAHSLELLEFLAISEITSVEIIDNPKQLRRLYAIVNSSVPPYGEFRGSIISIYTRVGKGIYGALTSTNKAMNYHTIPVFATEKEFYVPRYDTNGFYEASVPDYRSTIYWKPELKLDESGNAELDFYHSDNTGDFVILVEGITSIGQLGYATFNYQVQNNTD